MGAPYGGETAWTLTPEAMVTAQAPAGTDSATPVNVGDIFELGATDQEGSHWRLIDATAGEDVEQALLVVAMTYAESATADVTVAIIGDGAHRTFRLPYRAATGTPTVGQSIQVDTTDVRKVMGATWAAHQGKIMKVDTSNAEVEVLF